jgi:hypothetical protein
MPVQITSHDFSAQEMVETDVVLGTVEKNRDRIRTTAGMLLTLSGMLISFSAAFLLFVTDKAPNEHSTIAAFASAVVAFVAAAVLAISATFLRTKYSISDKTKFVTDLLRLYNSELRLLRLASLVSIIGLLLLVAGATSFVLRRLT